MDSVTREDLKRNELGEAIGAGIHYAEDHKRMILMAVGGVAAAIVIAASVVLWISSRKSGSNELLAEALRVDGAAVVATGANPADPARPTFASESARRARAKELFTELDSRYGGSKTGRVAKLYLAQIAVAENDKEKAKSYYEKLLFEQGGSIFVPEARDRFRRLRGDHDELDTPEQKFLNGPQ